MVEAGGEGFGVGRDLILKSGHLASGGGGICGDLWNSVGWESKGGRICGFPGECLWRLQ